VGFNKADEPETPTDAGGGETTIRELRGQTFYADAVPENPAVLNDDAADDRILDELF
jgi:hypothetical protein